jgi:hypothetical protein
MTQKHLRETQGDWRSPRFSMKRSRRLRNGLPADQPQTLAAKNNRLILKALKATSPLQYSDLTRKIYPRLIDPIFSKLGGPFGQFAPALNALLRRGCWVFDLFKRPCSELRCPYGLQSRVRAIYWGGRFQPFPRQRFGGLSLRGLLSSPLAVVRKRPKLTRNHAVSYSQSRAVQHPRCFQIFLAQHADRPPSSK